MSVIGSGFQSFEEFESFVYTAVKSSTAMVGSIVTPAKLPIQGVCVCVRARICACVRACVYVCFQQWYHIQSRHLHNDYGCTCSLHCFTASEFALKLRNLLMLM